MKIIINIDKNVSETEITIHCNQLTGEIENIMAKGDIEKIIFYLHNEELETIHTDEPDLEMIFMTLTSKLFYYCVSESVYKTILKGKIVVNLQLPKPRVQDLRCRY